MRGACVAGDHEFRAASEVNEGGAVGFSEHINRLRTCVANDIKGVALGFQPDDERLHAVEMESPGDLGEISGGPHFDASRRPESGVFAAGDAAAGREDGEVFRQRGDERGVRLADGGEVGGDGRNPALPQKIADCFAEGFIDGVADGSVEFQFLPMEGCHARARLVQFEEQAMHPRAVVVVEVVDMRKFALVHSRDEFSEIIF